MSDEPVSEKQQAAHARGLARISRFYATRPWLGCLGTVASIVGIPLALYLAPSSTPRLIFRVSPSRSVIVARNQEVGGLRVLHGAQEIHSEVTAVQLSLWNQGRGAARGAAILEPVRIVTNPQTPILAASIQKVTRPLTEVSLDTSSLASGVVPVHFKILERGDGVLVQLVYAGPTSVDIAATGAIEGQRSVEVLRESHWKFAPWVAPLFLIVIFGVLIVGMFVTSFKETKGSTGRRLLRAFAASVGVVLALVLGTILVVAVGTAITWLFVPPTGPFAI
jgi:hypothetical protein